MGCFLGCFGSKKDRKRRKQRHKLIPRDQNEIGQNIVQGDVSLVQSINNNPSDSLPELRVKNNEPSMELKNNSSLLKPVENLSQWKSLKSNPLNSDPQKENSPFPSKNRIQESEVNASISNLSGSSEQNTPNNKPISSENSVKSVENRPIFGALTSDELKQSSSTPRKSPGRSPDDDMPIIGSVGSYWSHSDNSAKSLNSISSYKGIPNTTSKYREDKKVNWHNTPFETRLERALNRDAAATDAL